MYIVTSTEDGYGLSFVSNGISKPVEGVCFALYNSAREECEMMNERLKKEMKNGD